VIKPLSHCSGQSQPPICRMVHHCLVMLLIIQWSFNLKLFFFKTLFQLLYTETWPLYSAEQLSLRCNKLTVYGIKSCEECKELTFILGAHRGQGTTPKSFDHSPLTSELFWAEASEGGQEVVLPWSRSSSANVFMPSGSPARWPA